MNALKRVVVISGDSTNTLPWAPIFKPGTDCILLISEDIK